MSLRRHVCCLLLRVDAPKDHIWVSESVLNSAIHRFAHGTVLKRSVCLAPGPLEARKRATKRRMMNLAQIGGGGGFDPGVLPGLGVQERMEWKWQSPTPLISRRPDEITPLPSWLTDPPPDEADKCLEKSEKAGDVEAAKKDEAFKHQYADLPPEVLLKNPGFWEDLQRCSDVAGLYGWAASYGIDVHMYPKLLFARLCFAGQKLPVLLHALEDPALGTPGNLNFLLDWQLRDRKGEGRLRRRIKPDDVILLQGWMRRQLHLGLKTEEDIFIFLRYVSRVSDATNDESLKCNLIACIFEGLQSSSIFGFKDLGTEVQCRLLESITQGPVTRQSLDLGFSLVNAMQQSQVEGADQRMSSFIGGIFSAHALVREHKKRETRFLEVIPRILEMIEGLPQELACSVILIMTKALTNEHCRIPAIKAVTTPLLDVWWSALAKTDILDFSRTFPLKTEIELFLSTQKLEVVVPYLQQLDDRNKASFILRYWLGPQNRSGRSRARYLFDGSCSAEGKDSPWINMFQAAGKCAQSSMPMDAPVKKVFKVLQMLHQSETIVEIIEQAEKFHSIVDESDVVYTIREHLGEQPHLAERIFHFYPGLPLEMCPELAEQMVLDPKSDPSTALRYMRSRSLRIPVLCQASSQLRAQLLDRMALAYSRAPHLTPRMAFRNVHKRYTRYTKERLGLPSVAMARALTHAGLIRPLQAGRWVNTTQVRWVLSAVRSVEGIDVADEVDRIVYKWRGDNARKIRAASLANRRARHYATKFST